MWDLGVNLFAMFIGLLISRGYGLFTRKVHNRAVKLFWRPSNSQKIFIHFGQWDDPNLSFGEKEPMVNIPDLLAVGELKAFLESNSLYSEVIVTPNIEEIDWKCPVISIGGPLVNKCNLSKYNDSVLPLWFLNMPYMDGKQRSIGNKEEEYRSTYSENGQILSDVGFIARMKLPQSEGYIFIIASNHATGNLGIARFLTSTNTIREIYGKGKPVQFQAIIRTHMKEGKINHIQLEHIREVR